MTGSCHCGAVTIEVAHKPDYLFDCNCSLCSKHGVLWGYFEPFDVIVSGHTLDYARADRELPAVHVHFCGICGCTTHWTPNNNAPRDKMGINMRLFEPEQLSGIPLHFPDGQSWTGEGAFGMRRASSVF